MNSVELMDEKQQLKDEVKKITELAKKEIRMLTDEEKGKLNEIKEQIEKINGELRELDVELPQETNNQKTKETMEKNFSLVKAIRNVANNVAQDELTQSVINEGMAEMRGTGNSYQGQIILPTETRTVTKTVEGADVVATDIFNVMEAIHSKSVMAELGCNIISGLTNDVQIPLISSVNCTWEAETATTSDSTPTFTSVKLQPKRISCVVPISKMLLQQDSTGVEAAIRNEITKAIMGKLESTVFGNAAGSATKPEGIFYNGGSALTQITSFADVCAMEAGLDGYDNYGEKKYLMSPTAKAALRGMIKGTNGTGMVFENGEVDGTPAYATQFVPTNDIAYGDWSNLIIGLWSGLDLVVDNYTLAADGCVRLVVNFYADAKLARSGAIALRTL